MSNYSILEQNVLPTFKTDEAQREFLWAGGQSWADRYLYRPEAYARMIDKIVLTLNGPMDLAIQLLKDQGVEGDFSDWNFRDTRNPHSLTNFIIQRARGWFIRCGYRVSANLPTA